MMNYGDLQYFVSSVTPIVEDMGGFISGYGDLDRRFISVGVRHDKNYEKTRKIMEQLQELFGGEIKYHDYWESEGYVPHSQAELIIDEQKALAAIRQDEEYYAVDDEYMAEEY